LWRIGPSESYLIRINTHVMPDDFEALKLLDELFIDVAVELAKRHMQPKSAIETDALTT
jgi:hypothetical protein